MKEPILLKKENIIRYGYIDNFLYAEEIKGAAYKKFDRPFKAGRYMDIVIMNGRLRMLINGEEHMFQHHTLVNIPIWSDIWAIECSEDFHAMVAAADKSVILDIFRNRNPFPEPFKFRVHLAAAGLSLTRKEADVLSSDISNLINSLKTQDHHFTEEINYAYFYIFMTDIANLLWGRFGEGMLPHNTDLSRQESIMKDLVPLLDGNIEKETGIGFYADSLCISKQYLSLVVRQKTHTSFGTIIALLRVEKATSLLREPDLSIQQIADRLSFHDQSAFGKFFKKHVGMSPLKYRNSLKKTLLTQRSEKQAK